METNRLREIRESQGLAIPDLAEITGFSEITLRNWEKGKFDPMFKIRVLADALGVKPSDLFEGYCKRLLNARVGAMRR